MIDLVEARIMSTMKSVGSGSVSHVELSAIYSEMLSLSCVGEYVYYGSGLMPMDAFR